MNKIKQIITVGFFAVLSFLVFVLSLPFILLFLPINYFRRKKFETKYSEFLTANNGKNFFCYNNRQNAKEFIESDIIPMLTKSVEIVYLNGKKIQSDYLHEFMSNAFYNFKSYSKFPHLMKIRDGQLIDQSINVSFYSVLNQGKPKEKLVAEIFKFLEI